MRPTNPDGKVMHLKDYGIEDESPIGAVMRVPGGSVEKRFGPKVKLSKKPDMLYMDDQAVDMPCGHAIGELYIFFRQLICLNNYWNKILIWF